MPGSENSTAAWRQQIVLIEFLLPGMDEQNQALSNQNQKTHSMIEIFTNLLSFILLGITATALGIVFFQIINKYWPDPLARVYYGAFSISALHYSLASLIVAFPIYLWMLWFWFKSFKNAPEKTESRLSKWLTYIILLIAAGTIIGDLIAGIFNFLQGELTVRFVLKALTILVIAGLALSFYFLERKKIQYKKEVSTMALRLPLFSAIILVLLAIGLGFLTGGTPGQERLRKFDLQRAENLRQIAQSIGNFAYDNNRLPKDLNELKENTRYYYDVSNALDPQTQKEYEYQPISSDEYELCAFFNFSTLDEIQIPDDSYLGDRWSRHNQGKVCQKGKVTFGSVPKGNPFRPLPLP